MKEADFGRGDEWSRWGDRARGDWRGDRANWGTRNDLYERGFSSRRAGEVGSGFGPYRHLERGDDDRGVDDEAWDEADRELGAADAEGDG